MVMVSYTRATLVALFVWIASPYRPTIKGALLTIMSWYKQLQRLRLRLLNDTVEDEAHRNLVSGRTWETFCETLKVAGTAIIQHGTPKDPVSQAEGYRYLSRLLRVSLEAFVECNDPEFPTLVALSNGSRVARVCIGSDNPDNLYLSATIDARNDYVVRGTRGTVHYLGFGTQAGGYGQPGGLSTVDYKEANELTLNLHLKQDQIVLYLSRNEPTDPVQRANWLRLDPTINPHVLIVRNTFIDRTIEVPSKLTIHKMKTNNRKMLGDQSISSSGNDKIAGSISCKELEDGLATAGMFVAATPLLFCNWANGFQKHVNTLPLFDQITSNKMGGDPNIRYYHSAWKIEKNEVLVIDAIPPICDTWNIQINNYWMESLDYRYHTIHTNKGLATYQDNQKSKVRIIVAHQIDATIKNVTWLSCCGRTEGTMCFRWIKPRDESGQMYPPNDASMPNPTCRIVSFEELPMIDAVK